MTKGLIFDIQHFSLHDGPGIRTTVFMKGCSLNCAWCHNPESIDLRNGLMFEEEKCIGCRACETVCRHGVHSFLDGKHAVDFSKCVACGECGKVCFAGALKLIARSYKPSEIAETVLRDRGLYMRSGGGATFSGGEPLLQAAFIKETAEILKEQGIHIAVDTALNVPRENIDLVLPYADLFLCDLKAVSEDVFKRFIGTDNRRIMENLGYVSSKKNVFIRIPVVKGVNDSLSELTRIRDAIDGLGDGVKEVGLLSYHDLGIKKALKVGREETRFEIQGSGDFASKLELFKNRGYRLLFDGSEVV